MATALRNRNTVILRPADRAGWLRERGYGIGSSEIATVVGLNPFETPYQLWRRKRGLDGPKEETFAMRAGHYLEDAVARFWADETGGEVIRGSAGDWIVARADKPFLRVSPDRTYWPAGARHNDANKGILECKTTQRAVDPEDLPRHWFCQLQYQLGVAGFREGSLAWLCAGREFGCRTLAFVPEFFEWLASEAERFWTENVVGGVEPPAVSPEDVVAKFTRPEAGKTVEADEGLFADYRTLKEVREEIAALDARREELEGRMKVALGDAETLAYRGETIATWKASRDGERFDGAGFRKAHPELADLTGPFVRAVPGARRFLLK